MSNYYLPGNSYVIYTFNTDLTNSLHKFTAPYPELCEMKDENTEISSVSYIVQNSRVSIHLNSPQGEARRKAASENAIIFIANKTKPAENITTS